MSEFIAVKKPKPSNWKLFYKALGDIREALKDSNFEPTQKQQDTIISLLQIHVSNIYARDCR